MKTRTCWRCSSRGRHENSFRSKLFRDWEWLKYCERLLLAAWRHSTQIGHPHYYRRRLEEVGELAAVTGYAPSCWRAPNCTKIGSLQDASPQCGVLC